LFYTEKVETSRTQETVELLLPVWEGSGDNTFAIIHTFLNVCILGLHDIMQAPFYTSDFCIPDNSDRTFNFFASQPG
jgi:hypothetical protein